MANPSELDPARVAALERKLERAESILEAVASSGLLLLKLPEWESYAEELLANLGRATEVSRAYIFRNSPGPEGETLTSLRFEWVAPGVEAQIENPELQNSPLEEKGFDRWVRIMGEGGVVEGRVRDFPLTERNVLEAQGLQSLLAVPIFVEGRWWGFMGFDDCWRERGWSRSEQQALRAAAHTLGAAIQRATAEHAVRTRELHYRRLVETSPYAIWALDPTGRFTEVNPAGERLIQRPAHEILGRPFSAFFSPEDLSGALEAMEAVLAGEGEVVEAEVRVRRPSGEKRLLRTAATPVVEGDRVLGVHGLARDITDERGREEQLRRARRLASVGTLVGGVAHELNNPFTTILGIAQLLHDDLEPSDREELLDTLIGEVERSARIVADLRLLAGRPEGRQEEPQPVSLNDAARHALRIRRSSLKLQDIEVLLELDPHAPRVSGDAGQLVQGLLNLIVNAEQALENRPRPRRITIRTRRARGQSTVEIQDNGPGIPTEVRDRVFDPFWTTKGPDLGMGLGLSITHGIVSEHGGTLEFARGEGAHLILRLPALDGSSGVGNGREGTPSSLDDDPEGLTSPSLHLLVVENDAESGNRLCRELGDAGHAVDHANDGIDALRRIRSTPDRYDVVLSGLRMPRLGGEDLLHRLREDDPAWTSKFVLMAQNPFGPVPTRLTREWGVEVLRRPADIGEVRQLLRRRW